MVKFDALGFNYSDVYQDWFNGVELTGDQVDFLFDYIENMQSAMREISESNMTKRDIAKLIKETLND